LSPSKKREPVLTGSLMLLESRLSTALDRRIDVGPTVGLGVALSFYTSVEN
jgi:hypothetical protein